jgi:serine protease Do
VDPNGAAGEGGLQKGDVIVKINDEEVNADARLAELIATEKPGDNVKITFLRNGAEQNTEVVLKDKLGAFVGVKTAEVGSLGADLADLSKEDADKLDLQGGVVVSNIRDGLLSAETDMRSGFIITKVGDIPVKSVEEFKIALNRQDSNFQLQGVYPDDGKVYYYGINDFKK